jgi:hypothetical protein
MKTSTLLLCAVLIASTLQVEATVRRVNYVQSFATSCATCYYGATSFQQAIDASIDGDTIHLEPSDFSYGDVTIAKRLVIIGAGYKLGAAPFNAGLQANTQTSMVRNIELVANSNGTQIIGLHLPGGNYSGLSMFSTSNIRISRNFIYGLSVYFPNGGTGVQDITISENFMTGGVSQNGNYSNTITNLTIRNNIISGQLELNGGSDQMTNVVVTNNTFNYNGSHQLTNANVAFNVFNLGNIAGTNNTIHDNITAAAITGADLVSNPMVSMGNVFNLSVGTDDSKYEHPCFITLQRRRSERTRRLQRYFTLPVERHPEHSDDLHPAVHAQHFTPGDSVEVTLSTRTNN